VSKKVKLDPPRSPSLWPEKKLTASSDLSSIINPIPDYIERAREALLCVESRCDRGRKKGASIKLDNIARQIRALLPTLEEWRKEIDAVIADGVGGDSGLF